MENSNGQELVAEAAGTGRKKEVVAQCALEACRMLDANGLLRQEAGNVEHAYCNGSCMINGVASTFHVCTSLMC